MGEGERGEMNYIFYDTETTGTNTAFDQILQFAAIYTDEHLQELDRFEIRSLILTWVVPHPKALQVTGIAPGQLVDEALPDHFEMVRQSSDRVLR
jgi:exodeoxyribonuclease-1